MANDPAFLFYPGDYLRDTQCLSEKVQVSYDRIMCEHMRNICISQDQLNFFTKRLSEDEKQELMLVLSKVEGGFQITWVAESICKRKAYSESRRKNRESPKAKDKKNISSSYVKHMENEIENENTIENGNGTKGVWGRDQNSGWKFSENGKGVIFPDGIYQALGFEQKIAYDNGTLSPRDVKRGLPY